MHVDQNAALKVLQNDRLGGYIAILSVLQLNVPDHIPNFFLLNAGHELQNQVAKALFFP